jgi:hypothetical protein
VAGVVGPLPFSINGRPIDDEEFGCRTLNKKRRYRESSAAELLGACCRKLAFLGLDVVIDGMVNWLANRRAGDEAGVPDILINGETP